MRALEVVVAHDVGELSLEIGRRPEGNLVEELAPDGADEPLDGIDKLTASDEQESFASLTLQLLRPNVQTRGPDVAGRTPPTQAGVAG